MMNKYRLMSPGPTPIPSEVSAAGALPIIHHRTPEFDEFVPEAQKVVDSVEWRGS